MTQAARKYYTVEEYLARESRSLRKHEYYEGIVYLMSDFSVRHSRISTNAMIALHRALDDNIFEVFGSNLRVQVKANNFFTYPDSLVICGSPELMDGRDDTITNPVLLVEVLSPSTANYDRTTKFELYRELETFRDYILISQNKVAIDHYRRVEEGWLLRSYRSLEDSLELINLGVTISVKQFYRKVELKPTSLRIKRAKRGSKF